MKEKTKLPVGVSVLLTNKDHEVLLGIRLNSKAAGFLSTPGGRLEENESLAECAERELYEETGLTIHRHDLRLLGFKEHFRYGDHYLMFYYHIEWNGFPFTNREPNKCGGWRWTRTDQLTPENCTEPKDILVMLKTKSNAPPALAWLVLGTTYWVVAMLAGVLGIILKAPRQKAAWFILALGTIVAGCYAVFIRKRGRT